MPAAAEQLFAEGYRLPEFLHQMSNGTWHFPNRKAFEHETRAQIGDTYKRNGLASARNALDAASLVFGHSVLDYAATECCRACVIAEPQAWEDAVSGRQLALSEIKGSTYAALLKQSALKYVRSIGRDSLAKRIRILHKKVQPIPQIMIDEALYQYSEERIQELDKARQAIIHGLRLNEVIRDLETSIDYLDRTTRYLILAVSKHYGVHLDVLKRSRPPQPDRQVPANAPGKPMAGEP